MGDQPYRPHKTVHAHYYLLDYIIIACCISRVSYVYAFRSYVEDSFSPQHNGQTGGRTGRHRENHIHSDMRIITMDNLSVTTYIIDVL